MKSKVKTVLIVLIPILVIGVALIAYKSLSKNFAAPTYLAPVENRIEAVDFTVYDYEGNAYSFDDFKGKPIVINAWATWCKFCRIEMPAFQKAYDKYGDKVHFLMVDITDGNRETPEMGKKFIEENGFSFPVYYDLELSIYQGYLSGSFPTTIMIDSNGKVAFYRPGAMSEEQIIDIVDELSKQ